MKSLFITCLSCLLLFSTSCKKNTINTQQKTLDLSFTKDWSKLFGGSSYDYYWSGAATSDGGWIATGYTGSVDGDISSIKGSIDALVVKYDAAGNKMWQAVIGGSDQDYATAIHQLSDGTYIGAGYTSSSDGDITNNHGGRDAMLFKLGAGGVIQWVKALGGSDNEIARALVVNTDGTFAIAGYRTNSTDETANFDAWICKADQSGNSIWQKTYGGSDLDNVFSMVSDGSGGYAFAGNTKSTNGDAAGNNAGATHYWIVKIDALGNKQWHKTYGGSGGEMPQTIVKTLDGYVVIGRTASSDGDVTDQHGGTDAWVLKLSDNGNKLWQKTFGGSANDFGEGILYKEDGSLYVGINSQSTDGSFIANFGHMDAFVVKLDKDGNNLGQKQLGGSGNDEIFAFAMNNNRFCLFGASASSDGDMEGYQTDFFRNAWVLQFKDQ